MSQKSAAQLSIDNNNVIESQTAPDSIDPTTDGPVRQDIIDSTFNIVDGIKVGINGRSIKTAGAIPALYTGLNDGDSLETVLAKILALTNQTQIQVTGGIQGQDGEFAACITSDTRQVFEAHCTTSTYDPITAIQFANDKDNGGFDNGNNWLLKRYTASSAITKNFKVSSVEFEIAGSWAGGSSSSDYTKFKLAICKNGNTAAPLVTSADAIIRNDTAGGTKFYIPDFSIASVALAVNDYIEVFIYRGAFLGTSAPAGSRFKINSALFTNEG